MEQDQNQNQDNQFQDNVASNTSVEIPKKIKIIIWTLTTTVVLLLCVSGYFLFFGTKNPPAQEVKDASDEVTVLINEVKKHILLPINEVPTIATVSDLSLLKDQAFFANAKVGDKVLIYGQAKKAFLYSPTKKIIIEVAPVNLDPGNQTPGTTPTP